MMPDREAFTHALGAALDAPEPVLRLHDLLHSVLTIEPSAWESDEQRLIRTISERVDVTAGETTRHLALARNMQALLDDASSIKTVALLLELVADRERVLGVLRKSAHGTISRTGFLSFVAEQRWPETMRRRVAALPPKDLAGLVLALERGDIAQLEATLIS